MKINIMQKGDKVLNVTDNIIVIQRKNGEVDIFSLAEIIENLRVDTTKVISIGYGNNIVSASNDMVEISTF